MDKQQQPVEQLLTQDYEDMKVDYCTIEDDDDDQEDFIGNFIDKQCIVCQQVQNSTTLANTLELLERTNQAIECDKCNSVLCGQCVEYMKIKNCLKCSNPQSDERWYEKASCEAINEEETQDSFRYSFILPNQDARDYFCCNTDIKLNNFSRETRHTFLCTLCNTGGLSYDQFVQHYDKVCPNFLVKCKGCKEFQCARDQLLSHMLQCPESEYQCPNCEQFFQRKFLETHDCFSLLNDVYKKVLFDTLSQDALLGDLQSKDLTQRDHYKSSVLQILKQNKYIEQLNTIMGEEDLLEVQGYGKNFCRKCHSGGGHLMCSHCKDYICLSCREFCWKCIHKKEFIQQDFSQQSKNVITQSSFSRKREEKQDSKDPYNPPNQRQIIGIHQKQVAVNLCIGCVARCQDCKVKFCYRCKQCICNIHESCK